MIVYIVEAGEKHEGASVVGLRFNKDEAVKLALSQKAHYKNKCWDWDGEEPEDMFWVNGCDYVRVFAMEVL